MKYANKRTIYVATGLLLIMFAITSAQASIPDNSVCDQYIEQAEVEAKYPYPDYFKSGELYLDAAICYERRGDVTESQEAYSKAAEKFELAPQYLTGDHFVAAKSYEKSGLSYEAIGETSKAIEVYEKSISRYQSGGYSKEAERIQQVIKNLQEEDVSKTEKIQSNIASLIGLISLIILFISLSFLVIIALANLFLKRETPEEDDMGLDRIEEKSKKQEKAERIEKKKSPRERAIEKLRKKYKP